MTSSTVIDPAKVLGVSSDAGEAEIRARYLQLVKQFPPERDPERFREIQVAFEAAKDPLLIARRLLQLPSKEAPQWSDAIEEQKRIPPTLSVELLLSLGNRADSGGESDRAEPDSVAGAPDEKNDPNHKQHFVEQPHE